MRTSRTADAITRFRSAASLYESSEHRAELPRIYLALARAEARLGEIDAARRDLDNGIGIIALERQHLTDLAQRVSLVSASEALFEDAIDLAMKAGDHDAAFNLAESHSARALSEMFELGDDSTDREVVPISLTKIRQALAPDAAIVEYVALPDRLVTFVIRAEAFSVAVGNHPRQEVQTMLSAFADAAGRPQRDTTKASSAAYEVLLANVRDELLRSRHIAFVSDRYIGGVPFGALRDPSTQRLVIEDATVTTAPSAALLIRASRRAEESATTTPKALAIGATVFDFNHHPDVSPLQYVEEEAKSVASCYRGGDSVVGNAATMRALIPAAADYDIVHYAGHAITDTHRPSTSALLMAPVAGDTGEVRLTDVAHMRLRRTRLVVVAACRTAAGVKRNDGPENLALSFIAAGVPTVVASLWDLDDEYSLRFMTDFHRRVSRGREPSSAIRDVILSELREYDGTLRQPPQWMNIVVVGGNRDMVRGREESR